MKTLMKHFFAALGVLIFGAIETQQLLAQRPVVPGTGAEIIGVADDFGPMGIFDVGSSFMA